MSKVENLQTTTGSMVLWLAGFGVSICIWFAALVWACTRVRPRSAALVRWS
jgi:hypothetical protein